jgi:hypothetical protein
MNNQISYYKRVLSYDDITEQYRIVIPALGIAVCSDTEVGAIIEARQAVEDDARKAQQRPSATFPTGENS